ncbi:hypothetical protein [Bacillus sp. SG-1]|uniref:hypothetical protein n=1 Tax=Bacillus sp. SG-1 TaxID=161544 RepID=UPI0001544B41|nr:hypothetical protein [Bacillus sp. SG-1]EDL63066.1 hypothetical protein BSG1_20610 [Bacillus sp. SG-1]
MSDRSSKVIKGISVLVTVLTVLLPIYLFGQDLKAQTESGWSNYEKGIKGFPAQIGKIKDWNFLSGSKDVNQVNDSEDRSSNSPIGYVRVTSPQANIRSTPEVPPDQESNLVYKADEGQEIPYYETITADTGGVWYKLIHGETGEECWISEITIEKIE